MKILRLVVVVAIIAMCGFAEAGGTKTGNILQTEKGRFAFGIIDGIEYMVDTQTGRLWRGVWLNGDHSDRVMTPYLYYDEPVLIDKKVREAIFYAPNLNLEISTIFFRKKNK